MTAPTCHSLTPADLPLPFGRYVLESVLGEGGMAKVFRATLQGPAGFTKAVALKVIKGAVHEQMGEHQQALFLREARLGGLLRHPNLVDVYELGEVETEWFLSSARLSSRVKSANVGGVLGIRFYRCECESYRVRRARLKVVTLFSRQISAAASSS